ncbi:MAG TPA: hypothetical protein PKH33_02820 [bacterium]|nr:hypothetical protein [bacterium]
MKSAEFGSKGNSAWILEGHRYAQNAARLFRAARIDARAAKVDTRAQGIVFPGKHPECHGFTRHCYLFFARRQLFFLFILPLSAILRHPC